MAELKIVDFKPRWMRELSQEDRRILSETPPIGAVPEGAPRINTRLVLAGNKDRVSFKTLSDALDRTQAIVQFAAYDISRGLNPNFADLRSAGADVLQLGKLTAEPFGEGSFIIPARLEGEAIEAGSAGERHPVTTQDVAKRFEDMLSSFGTKHPVTDVSIGAIQAIEALGQIIRREAGMIEYSLFDNLGRSSPPILVTPETIERASAVRKALRPTQSKLETLEGKVTALDLVEHTMILSLYPSGERVSGIFSPLFQSTLIECLGRNVRLQGVVKRPGRGGRSITIEAVDVPDEE